MSRCLSCGNPIPEDIKYQFVCPDCSALRELGLKKLNQANDNDPDKLEHVQEQGDTEE